MARTAVLQDTSQTNRHMPLVPTPPSAENNKIYPEDRAAHGWFRFVLSFPPHLVRAYLDRFNLGDRHTVLDPFCGTGTTLVECKKRGISNVGIEAVPFAHFASQVKLDWSPQPARLLAHAQRVADATLTAFANDGIHDAPQNGSGKNGRVPLRTLDEHRFPLLLKDSISPLPLHKTLVLIDTMSRLANERYYGHEKLALAKVLVSSIGNLHFGPEVGIGDIKADAPVVEPWLVAMADTARDMQELRGAPESRSVVHHADARNLTSLLEPDSIDAVITSPPYPNEKDYTRTTRLESVLLGFIRDRRDLKQLKQLLVRSNTRNVYKGDDDDRWVEGFPEIQRISDEIEARRVELGKTSGFERLYPKVTKLYFGGMARHLAELRPFLRPGARLAYVVGDQASYLRVMIRTGQILADIAQSLGYELISIDLFRTRHATATRQQLREEVVVLQWPGRRKSKGSVWPQRTTATRK